MSKLFIGSTQTVNRVVADSGKIIHVRIDGYAKNTSFMWSVKVGNDWMSDNSRHTTARKAISDAAKFF
jgi:hypothetical protein